MEATLPVVECFHSLQGEGAHTGRSAFFIRLASCKVGCPWCDTKQSWSAENHPQIRITKLAKDVAQAASQGANFLVITGGEPLHHNLNPLCSEIRKKITRNRKISIPIHLETSGVDAISGDPNWITLSPKPHSPPRIELLATCHELKVIVNEESDLQFAEEMATQAIEAQSICPKFEDNKVRPLPEPLLFLQPGWSNKKGKILAFEYVRTNPKWRLSMQTHKWLEIL